MFLDLNDPASIVAWWRVCPERHAEYLTHKLTSSPQFAPAIREAQQLISSDPELRAAWQESVRARKAREAQEAERQEKLTAHALEWREFAEA